MMIDFHTHIIPNVDDGSKCMDETIELLKEAKSAGFETIILTSHYLKDYYQTNVDERTKILSSIQSILEYNKIDIKLVLGNEIYISDNIIELIESKRANTINGTKYILFELPFNIVPENLYYIVYNMLEHKYIPILAHPERYSFVQKNPNIVGELIEKGVLMQANYGSFVGQYGRKAQIIVKKLLKSNMIYFLGTDVHRKNTIYPQIPQILSSMEKYIGKEKLELITKVNPKKVLENKKVEVKSVEKIKLSFLEKLIIKRL